MQRQYGQREVGLWAQPSEQILRGVGDTLGQFALDPDRDAVWRLFTKYAHIAATGWPSLLRIAGGTNQVTLVRQDVSKRPRGNSR